MLKNTDKAIGLVADLLATHYNGIKTLDAKETERFRADYIELHEKFTGCECLDFNDILAAGQQKNIIKICLLAKRTDNKQLIAKLKGVISKLSADGQKPVLQVLKKFSALKSEAIVLPDESYNYNRIVVAELENTLGAGNYRFSRELGSISARSCLGKRTFDRFTQLLNQFAVEQGISRVIWNSKLECLDTIVLHVKQDDSFVRYDENNNSLIVSPRALYVNKTELHYGLVREVIRFLQYINLDNIADIRELSDVARAKDLIPPRTSIEDLLQELFAEVVALGSVEQSKWKSLRNYSDKLNMLCAVVRYLQQKKRMSVKGAAQLCFEVGSAWRGVKPTAKLIVRCFPDLLRLGAYELEGVLAHHLSDTVLDAGVLEVVVNSINAIMLNGVIDANPFMRSTMDVHEHIERNVASDIRADLTDFIVTQRKKEQSDSSQNKLLARFFTMLGDIKIGCSDSCLKWASHILDGIAIEKSNCLIDELADAGEVEVCAYIKDRFEKDFAERRTRLNLFKRAFIGAGCNRRDCETILGEMLTKGDSPCARRWDSLIRSLGLRDKDNKGLPKLVTLVERLRSDGICSFLVDDGVGQNYIATVGCHSARQALHAMLEKGGNRSLTTEERKNFLATSILAMMYGNPDIMKLTPEEKLGIFAGGYFLAEENLGETRNKNKQEKK